MRTKARDLIQKIDEQERVIPPGSHRKATWWRVNLGKKITGTQRSRRYFDTEREAKRFLEDCLDTKVVEGHEAFAISPALRVEAKKCQDMLDEVAAKAGRPLSLTQAVSFFLRNAVPQGGVKLFENARDAFVASRRTKNLRPRYLVNLESQFRQLEAEFGGKRVNVITAKSIEEWLAGRDWSPKTKNNYVVTLRSFFDYCVRQKWCAENPAMSLEKSASDDSVTGILTVTESERILDAAREFPDVLPVLAIQLFAGLRRSEACALDWSEVRGNVIEVTAAKAKTRARRVVDVQPVLAAWLQPFQGVSGRIFLRSEDSYNESLRKIVIAANETGAEQAPPWPAIEWKHNCLRHTCASMHLAHFANDGYTALQLGHGVDVLHRHYKGLVSKETAALFWKLTPGCQDLNVGPAVSRCQQTG
jgi:integrase